MVCTQESGYMYTYVKIHMYVCILFAWLHAVQQYADSVLQEVFPCVVACRIREVEDRSVQQLH